MTSAPAWVSYTALVVASGAALASATAARIAWLAYRVGGPQIELAVQRGRVTAENVLVKVTAINKGRGEITLTGFAVTPYGGARRKAPRLAIDEVAEGQPLPFRLSGNSQASWTLNVLPVARRYDSKLRDGTLRPYSSWPELFYISAGLGNNGYAHEKTFRLGARTVIAEADAKRQG